MIFLIYFLWLLQLFIVNGQAIDKNQPMIQEIPLPKNINLNQIRLNCDLEQGLPPFAFEWYFNDKKLEDNNKTTIKIRDDSSVLIIKSISVDDLGEYKCVVKNDYGEDVRKVSLYVNSKFYNQTF